MLYITKYIQPVTSDVLLYICYGCITLNNAHCTSWGEILKGFVGLLYTFMCATVFVSCGSNIMTVNIPQSEDRGLSGSQDIDTINNSETSKTVDEQSKNIVYAWNQGDIVYYNENSRSDSDVGTGTPVRNKDRKSASSVINVALLLPTGDTRELVRDLSWSIYEAARMALSDMQGGGRIRLVLYDTASGAAKVAAQDALHDEADIILGPLFAENLDVVRGVVHKYKIPVLSFSTESGKAGNGVYLMGFIPKQEVCKIMDYALLRGYRNFVIFAQDGRYGDAVVRIMDKIADNPEVNIIETVRYSSGYKGIETAVGEYASVYMISEDDGEEEISEAYENELENTMSDTPDTIEPKIDAILLADGGKNLQTLAAYLAYNDLDTKSTKLLGLGGWKSDITHRESILRGGWFVAPHSLYLDRFYADFDRMYGYAPTELSALGYDAMAAVGVMVAEQEKYQDRHLFDVRRITDNNGFYGVMGAFRFNYNGENDRNLAVLEVNKDSFSVVEKASRKSFALDFLSQECH